MAEQTSSPSSPILSLPIELVYKILDNLDDYTILCSIRDSCKKLNDIVDVYPRYRCLFSDHYEPSFSFSYSTHSCIPKFQSQ
ncbi:unnamed protein product [Rotaria socialis]|uniref:F-box domain-containing protein n=2 Tax=Rotaria socialis TaxID=392032 RepID=A0A818P6I4_9BILA|nr:unnamed protein product [Rotaria socialis]